MIGASCVKAQIVSEGRDVKAVSRTPRRLERKFGLIRYFCDTADGQEIAGCGTEENSGHGGPPGTGMAKCARTDLVRRLANIHKSPAAGAGKLIKR